MDLVGVKKNQNLSDSKRGTTIKKREKKHNEKIKGSIDKIKKLYRHMNFYESLVPSDDQ